MGTPVIEKGTYIWGQAPLTTFIRLRFDGGGELDLKFDDRASAEIFMSGIPDLQKARRAQPDVPDPDGIEWENVRTAKIVPTSTSLN